MTTVQTHDSQTDDLLAALGERGIYSRGDFEEWLRGYGPGFLAGNRLTKDNARRESLGDPDDYDSLAEYEEHMAALGDPDLEADR